MADSSSEASSEEELNLDEDGRCAIGGSIDLSTRCFDSALPSVSEQLLADCSATFTARATGVGEELSAGCTFWVPATTRKPKTTLERLALDIFAYHARDAVYDPEKSGAEWWTQVIEESDEIGLHWDRDYDMQADQGILLHPMLATVTYLGVPRGAAPTIVLARPSPLLASESACGAVPHAASCWPSLGRHLCFDGKLLHGALPDLTPPAAAATSSPSAGSHKRVTFLVNVWLNHAPWGAEEVPKALSKRLSKAAEAGLRMGLAGARARPPEPLVLSAARAAPVASWTFGEPKARLSLQLPWPKAAVAALLASGCSAAPFVGLAFAEDSGAALVAAPKEPKKKKKRKEAAPADAVDERADSDGARADLDLGEAPAGGKMKKKKSSC